MSAERLQEMLAELLNRIWYDAHPARWLLWPVAVLYELAVTLRRAAYRRGWFPVVEVSVPVIVVGNISVGGTGKTPFIIWLADQLRRRRLRVGIIARGYRGSAPSWPQTVNAASDAGVVGDEPVLLARRTSCPVVAGPDRVAAARYLLEHAQVDVLLSDDGLQHYHLARRIEVAVVDGTRGMGNGFCLPAGPLREPARRINEVDAIVVNGGDWGHAGVFKAIPRITEVRQLSGGAVRTLESFKGKRVHAVAGIGNPQRFFDLLEDADLEVIPHPLPDHADVNAENLRFTEPGSVLLTEKDAVKCERLAHPDVWCVAVDLTFDADTGARLLRVLTRDLGAAGR